MALTLEELKARLALIDEVSILEVLEITAQELVERFEDKVETNYDALSEDLEEEEENV